MAYNQSRVKMFRRCQRQYSFRYDMASVLGLDPTLEMVPKVKKVQLERGTWMHKLLEAHNREWAGVKTKGWQKVHKQLTRSLMRFLRRRRRSTEICLGSVSASSATILEHGDRILIVIPSQGSEMESPRSSLLWKFHSEGGAYQIPSRVRLTFWLKIPISEDSGSGTTRT